MILMVALQVFTEIELGTLVLVIYRYNQMRCRDDKVEW